MAMPSSLYAEDENARQTLANGTVLKWTKQLENIHALNVETDLSISYTNWANEPMMTRANRGFHQWQGGCVSGGDLGYNQSTGFTYQHATGIKQLENGQPRIDSLQSHVVLSNGGGYYVWGYNPESSSRISGSSGNQRRYLLDMDINKMIFNCTITVVDKSFFDNVDYTTNPENMPAPSEHNITLKELYTHPELYYCTGTINWSNTYVYGEDTSDHWRGVAIRPSILLTGESIGEYQGADNSIFGTFTSNGSFSYDSRDPNGHANFGGGGSSNTLYNRMNAGYFMGCKNEIDMTPTDTFDSAGGMSTAIALDKWGNTNFSRFAYCNGQIFDYGDSVIWCAWGCRVVNNSDTGAIYRDYTFGTRRYIKADKMLKYIASFGLYFMSESFDPDTVSLTPETLGDDSRIMLGEMSADGTTTGRWITDIDSYRGPNKDGKTSNPNYDPSGGGGGNTDGDDIDDHIMGAGSQLSGIATMWLLTRAQLVELHESFANAPANFDPLGSFISVMGLGISAFKVIGDSLPWTLNPIKIRMSNGELWTTGAEGHIVDSQVSAFNETNLRVKRRYNNFLDYSPYATHEIFVPMCGWITLPDIAVDRPITVTYIPDIESLKCRAVVSVVDNSGNRCVVGEKEGVMGAEIPFTNTGHSLWVANLVVNSMDVAGEMVTGAIGAGFTKTTSKGATYRPYEGFTIGMAGTLPGAIGNALLSGNVNRTHYTTGNGSRVGFGDGENIQIKSTYHRVDKPNNYDHTVGKVCNKTGQLSSFTGFTVCENPHINFSATEREKEEIKQLLEQGVIL